MTVGGQRMDPPARNRRAAAPERAVLGHRLTWWGVTLARPAVDSGPARHPTRRQPHASRHRRVRRPAGRATYPHPAAYQRNRNPPGVTATITESTTRGRTGAGRVPDRRHGCCRTTGRPVTATVASAVRVPGPTAGAGRRISAVRRATLAAERRRGSRWRWSPAAPRRSRVRPACPAPHGRGSPGPRLRR